MGKDRHDMQNVVLCTKQSKNKYVTYNVCELACDSQKSATHSQALHCKHNTREAMAIITFRTRMKEGIPEEISIRLNNELKVLT